jgi:HSP20 family protein
MTSFFDKLKRGMGVDPTVVEEEVGPGNEEKMEEEKKITRKPRAKKPKKLEIEIKDAEKVVKKIPLVKIPQIQSEEEEEIKTVEKKEKPEAKEKWPEPEGQLAVDIYHTENDLIIQSAIAGVKPEDLDISLERDVITIQGERKKPFEEPGDYFTQECYWGRFIRQIILPVEVNPDGIEAKLKEGVLTIRIPKIQRERKRKILIKGQ